MHIQCSKLCKEQSGVEQSWTVFIVISNSIHQFLSPPYFFEQYWDLCIDLSVFGERGGMTPRNPVGTWKVADVWSDPTFQQMLYFHTPKCRMLPITIHLLLYSIQGVKPLICWWVHQRAYRSISLPPVLAIFIYWLQFSEEPHAVCMKSSSPHTGQSRQLPLAWERTDITAQYVAKLYWYVFKECSHKSTVTTPHAHYTWRDSLKNCE